MNHRDRIFVAGHKGMIGAAFLRYFQRAGYENVLITEVDLLEQALVREFFHAAQPEYVVLAAGKSGGILANQMYPGEFIYHNLQVQNNVIHAAYETGVKKLIFIARSCCYPRECTQPAREEMLLTGPLEPTSEAFSVAKIAGIKMCQAYQAQYGATFIPVIPANLYGPGDNFDFQYGHVLAALMRRMDEAKRAGKKQVTVWGTGAPKREFLYVDDFVDACVFLMKKTDQSDLTNIGSGEEVSVTELARMLKEVVGFSGEILFDRSKPDGVARKLLDSSRIFSCGWRPQVDFKQGLRQTYEWYKQTVFSRSEHSR